MLQQNSDRCLLNLPSTCGKDMTTKLPGTDGGPTWPYRSAVDIQISRLIFFSQIFWTSISTIPNSSPSPAFHTAKPYPKQVSVQPRPLAVNTTLPAFAAERRAAAQLLLGAGRTDGRPTVTYYAGSVENTAS